MKLERRLSILSEDQLLSRFGDLVRRDRHNTAHLLAMIAEIDVRKLWAKYACPSMFAFCVERFHMSESVTAKRIWAARTARRFPVALNMVARGELTLSAIQLLSKHLTQENHRAVLARARHKSTREVERLVVELAPKPDVPSRIRALPQASRKERAQRLEAGCADCEARASVHGSVSISASRESAASVPAESSPTAARAPLALGSASDGTPDANTVASSPGHAPAAAIHQEQSMSRSPRRRQLVPLSPRRYKLEVTLDEETHDRLRTLQDLLSHDSPNADPGVIVSKAIDHLLAETLKRKAAICDDTRGRRRRAAVSKKERRTRAIPAAVRRAVWRRDEGRCTFVDSKGRRCRATRMIQYHHERPYAMGGEHEEGNIALRCRAHNLYQADLDFGRGFMRAKRTRDAEDSARNVRECTTDGSPPPWSPAGPA